MQSLDDSKTAVLTKIYIIYHLLLLYYFVYVDNLLFLYICVVQCLTVLPRDFVNTVVRDFSLGGGHCLTLRRPWALPTAPSLLRRPPTARPCPAGQVHL